MIECVYWHPTHCKYFKKDTFEMGTDSPFFLPVFRAYCLSADFFFTGHLDRVPVPFPFSVIFERPFSAFRTRAV